jgi:hypothetical protein
MNHVTVHFIGICTHVSQSTLPDLPAKQRVVLVNARDGKDVRGMQIGRHSPVLDVAGNTIALSGCTMRLVTAHSEWRALDITETFRALPNLTNLMDGLTTLGPPSREVVLDANDAHAVCYFDIDFGSLSACTDERGAAVATLHVESEESISLEVTGWDGTALGTYPLGSDETLMVANTDEPSVPSHAHPSGDFLLHYKTAASMPHTPQIPQRIALLPCSFRHRFPTVGAGCSNSNYP